MRTENYNAWLDSLTEQEHAKIRENYGDDYRLAYYDLIKKLEKDFG